MDMQWNPLTKTFMPTNFGSGSSSKSDDEWRQAQQRWERSRQDFAARMSADRAKATSAWFDEVKKVYAEVGRSGWAGAAKQFQGRVDNVIRWWRNSMRDQINYRPSGYEDAIARHQQAMSSCLRARGEGNSVKALHDAEARLRTAR